MDVDAAAGRQVQNLLRKDLSVGSNDDDIGALLPQYPNRLRGFDPGGLKYGDAIALRTDLHVGFADPPAAALAPVRLGHNEADLVFIRIGKGLQRRNGEIRSPHVDDFQSHPPMPAVSQAADEAVLPGILCGR